MKPKELQNMIVEAIVARPRDERKYYHLCWWKNRLCCLPMNHTNDVHPSFFMASHSVLEAGLNPHQLQMVSERFAEFCEMRHIKIAVGNNKLGNQRSDHGTQGLKVTQFDLTRLQSMLGDKKSVVPALRDESARLRALLESAEIVPPEEIPSDVVTLNSKVRLQDRRSNLSMTLSLVFPGGAVSNADPEQTEAPILSPMGLSLLGRRVGDRIDGHVRIAELLYQPEARGDFHL